MGKYFLLISLLCIIISFGQQTKKDSLSSKSKFDTVICEKKGFDYKILRTIPDPSIDYKIIRVVPNKSIDYKIMRIVPNTHKIKSVFQVRSYIDTLSTVNGLPEFLQKKKNKKK